MSTTRLLIAAVLLAGLSGAIWWSNKKEAEKATQPDPKAPPKILTFKEEDLKQISIQRKGDPATVLARDASGKWIISEPQKLEVDTQVVSAITSSASNLSSHRVVADKGGDVSGYGLAPPQVSLTFTMKDGSTKHLIVGDQTADKSGTYAMLDGDPKLYTIEPFTATSFDKRLPDLRDKHLLTFLPDNLSLVALDVPGKPPIGFSRNGKERWQIVKPRPLRADSSTIDTLIAALKGAAMDASTLDAEGTDKAASAAFASAKPVAVAHVTAGSTAETLEVRKKDMDYYAKSSSVPGIFKVDPALGKSVDKTLADFQNKKLFDFGYDDVSKLGLKSKTNAIAFEKSGNDWLTNGRVMDPIGVQNAIDKLRDLAASRMDDVTASASTIELTVSSKDGKTTETVSLSPAGSDYIGRRPQDPTFYRIDGSMVSGLLQAFMDVHEAPPVDKGKGKDNGKK